MISCAFLYLALQAINKALVFLCTSAQLFLLLFFKLTFQSLRGQPHKVKKKKRMWNGKNGSLFSAFTSILWLPFCSQSFQRACSRSESFPAIKHPNSLSPFSPHNTNTLAIFSQMQPTFCNPNRFWEIYAYKSREFLSGVDCAIYLLSKKIDIHIQMTLKEKEKKEIGIQNVQNMYRIRNECANKAGRDHFMSLKQVHILCFI